MSLSFSSSSFDDNDTDNDSSAYTVLVDKRLSDSDVSLRKNTILIPKRDAKDNMPWTDPIGTWLTMRDLRTGTTWNFNYRCWPRKSEAQMSYILSETYNFVEENTLQAGDNFKIYKDELRNEFFVEGTPASDVGETSNRRVETTNTTERESKRVKTSNGESSNLPPGWI